MNRPDKVGEPSMEEILASIRQIIADGPERPPVSPLVGATELETARGATAPLNDSPPPPSLDRLSIALNKAKSPPRPPVNSLASALERKAPFDDGLGDLLEEVPEAPAAPSGPPDAAAADDALDDLLGPPQESTPSAESIGPAAVAGSTPPAPAAGASSAFPAGVPPPPPSTAMASLRPGSFYPPKGFSLDGTKRPDTTGPAFPSAAPPAVPGAVDETASASATPDAPEPATWPPSLGQGRPQGGAMSFIPDTGPALPPLGMTMGAVDPAPPFRGGFDASDDLDPARAPRPGAGANDTTAAAASALDALAQGLAASSIGAPVRPAGPHTTESPTLGTLVAQPLAPALHDANGYPIRTLEDAVADMLKPMLQQWLADNMPRIIERALRVEAARGVRSNVKPPFGS
jgi:cell pole-organizing protein PopZ